MLLSALSLLPCFIGKINLTSDLFLDVLDFKESDNYKLLHLVWRKFPRNRHSTEGQRTTATLSTQMEEASNAPLVLASSADLISFSRKILSQDTDCYSDTDLKKDPLDLKNGPLDQRSSLIQMTQCRLLMLDLPNVPIPHVSPGKSDIQRVKPRFSCQIVSNAWRTKNVQRTPISDSSIINCESIDSPREGWRRGSPKTFKTKMNSTTPKNSPKPDLPVIGKYEHKFSPKHKPFNIPTSFGSIPSGISDDGMKGKTVDHQSTRFHRHRGQLSILCFMSLLIPYDIRGQ